MCSQQCSSEKVAALCKSAMLSEIQLQSSKCHPERGAYPVPVCVSVSSVKGSLPQKKTGLRSPHSMVQVL